MNAFGNFLFQVARMIAGQKRREWIDAMQTEATMDGRGGQEWAMGSVIAALKDRASRDGYLFLAVILTPVVTLAASLMLFFPMSRLFMAGWLPSWVYNLAMLLVPLPFAWFLGRLRPNAALMTASISFAIFAVIPGMVFWIQFGRSPLIFFGPNATWYEMPWFIGFACALVVWLFGAWLGSRSRRSAA